MSKVEKRADLYKPGDEFEPLEFRVTQEWNAQFQEALEAYYPRYAEKSETGSPLVVPGLLIANSNITRSPGFRLDPGMAAVHAKEEVEYIHPGKVGKRFRVTWKVVDFYEKRERPYQVKEALIRDEDGVDILRRRMTDTFMGGPYRGVRGDGETNGRPKITQTRIQGDHTGDRTSIAINTPEESEFVGKLKTVTLDRINLFSGGFPRGPNWPAKNIHTDVETAIRCGLKSRAASGAMFEGYLTDLMVDLFGTDWLNYGKMGLAFLNIVDKDDRLIPKGIVKIRKIVGPTAVFTMEIWCENQYGDKVVFGTGTGTLGI